jgi:predicted nucleic acid-binding protein
MDLLLPPKLIPSLKDKHLLLDTNVFRDSSSFPTVFATFFNNLKKNDVTITTLDVVRYELLKGSANQQKYEEKENQINDVVDLVLPTRPGHEVLIYDLIKQYSLDGTALHVTDLFLGAALMQYKKNIFLMTRDTTDFMQNIFSLKFIINAPHKKGIFTYGIYQYLK